MPIVVECPRCKTKADMPDSAAGAKGKCRGCGAVVHVPKARKKCCSCGMDITHSPRWKDAEENYYCDICWQASFVAVDKHDEIATAIIQPSPQAHCDRCGGEFPQTYLTRWGRQNLCTRCHIAKRNQRAEEKQAWKEAGDAFATKIMRSAVLVIVFGGILTLVIVGISQYQDHARIVQREEREQRQRDDENAQESQRIAQEQQRRAAETKAEQEAEAKRAATEREEQARREAIAKAEAERQRMLRPARDALVQYGMARVDLDAATQYRKSEEELADAVARNMGASGNIDFSKLNEATDEATKALDQEHLVRQDCIKCLDKLTTFNQQILHAAAQDLIHDSSVDIHVREAVVGIMR